MESGESSAGSLMRAREEYPKPLAHELTASVEEDLRQFKSEMRAIGVNLHGLPDDEEEFDRAWPRIASVCFAKLIRI